MVFTNPEATIGDALPVTKCTLINNPCYNNRKLMLTTINYIYKYFISRVFLNF